MRSGHEVRPDNDMTGNVWPEVLTLRGAEQVWSYLDGPARPVFPRGRHSVGRGTAWYGSTCLTADGVDVHVGEPGAELLTGDDVVGDLHVPAGEVRVVLRPW